MNPGLRALLVTLVCIAFHSCSHTEGGGGKDVARRLESDRYSVDLGQLQDQPITQTFVLKSTGREPVSIARVGTYSGNITARFKTTEGEFPVTKDGGGATHVVLKPGQTASLELTVDAKGVTESRPRRVTVHSDDSVEPTLTLTLDMKAPKGAELAGKLSAEELGGVPPRITLSETKFDFGEIFTGEIVHHAFKVRNEGEGDLKITRISATCGCTVTNIKAPGSPEMNGKDLENEGKVVTLKPGEEADLQVSLDSRKMGGVLHKDVKIESNDRENNPTTIALQATAIKPVELNPERMAFGGMMRYTTQTKSTTVISRKLPNFEIKSVTAPVPFVKATWTKLDSKKPDELQYRIDVTIAADAPVGLIQDPLIVQTTSERVPEFQVPMLANILPPVAFDTGGDDGAERLDFGLVKGDTSVTRELHIINRHPEVPYTILSAEIESQNKQHFTCEVITNKAGEDYTVKLTSKPSLDARYFKGNVVLKSEYPDLLEKRISFQGWVARS